MSNRRMIAYATAALVAGLVLGSMGVATAAPAKTRAAATGLRLQMGATFKAAGATMADVVAKLTGQSVEDVRAAREEGKSFSAIAAEKNVSSEKVVSDTLAARKALLDKAVADKKITQAQADAAYAQMKTRLTERVDSTTACTGAGGGAGGGCGMGGGGRGMGGGRGAGGCGGCTTVTQ